MHAVMGHGRAVLDTRRRHMAVIAVDIVMADIAMMEGRRRCGIGQKRAGNAQSDRQRTGQFQTLAYREHRLLLRALGPYWKS
jgi:hypothetical protein